MDESARARKPARSARKMPLETRLRAGTVPIPALPAVGTGSHIDAIPNAGKYDGVVGVLGGLEAIRALQRGGFRPSTPSSCWCLLRRSRRALELAVSAAACSRGLFPPTRRESLNRQDGESLEDVRRKSGLARRTGRSKLPNGYYKAFVELHIEQGPCWSASIFRSAL